MKAEEQEQEETAFDWLSDISVIREGITVLIDRGKPISPADLQPLLDAVATKAQPTLNSEYIARALVPYLLAEMPTPQALQQAGHKGAAVLQEAMRQAIQHGKGEMSQAAMELGQAAERIPREVAVRGEVLGFTSMKALWIVVGLFLTAVTVIAVAFWYMGKQDAELAQTQRQLERSLAQERIFRSKRAALLQDYPTQAYHYFPYPGDPKSEPTNTSKKK